MIPGLLLLAGRRAVGKSTAADHLQARFDAIQIAQADPLKQLVGLVFGWPDELLHGPSSARDAVDTKFADRAAWRDAFERLDRHGPTWLRGLGISPGRFFPTLKSWMALLGVEGIGHGMSPRRALQTLGTDWGRAKVGPDVWVNAAILRAAFKVQDGAPLVVITDGRFENEIDRVRDAGGRVILLTAETTEKAGDMHPSERGLDNVPRSKFDWMIHNEKVERDLFLAQVETAARDLFKVAT